MNFEYTYNHNIVAFCCFDFLFICMNQFFIFVVSVITNSFFTLFPGRKVSPYRTSTNSWCNEGNAGFVCQTSLVIYCLILYTPFQLTYVFSLFYSILFASLFFCLLDPLSSFVLVMRVFFYLRVSEAPGRKFGKLVSGTQTSFSLIFKFQLLLLFLYY